MIEELEHSRLCCYWKCGKLIPANRLRRGCYFCTKECHAADRKARRRFKAKIACRLCGRGVKPQRSSKNETPDLVPVPSAHTVSHEMRTP
jgi:hypothetical protein